MSDELRTTKYPTNNRPEVVFTNERAWVNVAIRHTPDRLAAKALRDAHKALEGALRNLYPSAAWQRSGGCRRAGGSSNRSG